MTRLTLAYKCYSRLVFIRGLLVIWSSKESEYNHHPTSSAAVQGLHCVIILACKSQMLSKPCVTQQKNWSGSTA